MSNARYVDYATTLPPALIARLRELSADTRVPAAAIVRDILTPEALEAWARARGIGASRRLLEAHDDEPEAA